VFSLLILIIIMTLFSWIYVLTLDNKILLQLDSRETNHPKTTKRQHNEAEQIKYEFPFQWSGKRYKYRNATNSFTVQKIKILMHDADVCGRKLDFLVYIHSNPKHFSKRWELRSTWANVNLFQKIRFKTVFLIGKTDSPVQIDLNEEFEKHRDLIQGDFVDSYRNMTYKGVMALQWISEFCSNVPFVIKADDDAFVNIFEFLKLANSVRNISQTIICGLRMGNMPIIRDPKVCMKWCVKEDEFPGDKVYPPYCSGLAFILGSSVVKEMHKAVKRTPFFWVDDVYITGLLPQKVNTRIYYVNIVKRLGLQAVLGTRKLSITEIPFEYYIVHSWRNNLITDLWNVLLDGLTPEFRYLLSSQHGQFKQKT